MSKITMRLLPIAMLLLSVAGQSCRSKRVAESVDTEVRTTVKIDSVSRRHEHRSSDSTDVRAEMLRRDSVRAYAAGDTLVVVRWGSFSGRAELSREVSSMVVDSAAAVAVAAERDSRSTRTVAVESAPLSERIARLCAALAVLLIVAAIVRRRL